MFLALSIFLGKCLIVIAFYGFLRTIEKSPRHQKMVDLTFDLWADIRYNTDVSLRRFWEWYYQITDKKINHVRYF